MGVRSTLSYGHRVAIVGWALIAAVSATSRATIRFNDVAVEAGIRFRHVVGRSGKGYILETVGSGCALFDYDNDGWLDIYLVNGASLPGSEQTAARNALYRNHRDGTFAETTDGANVGDQRYGIGCVVGDYDGDGWLDLYVLNFGENRLYRNNGDGSFTDATDAAGVACPAWSASGAFLDYDLDGDLDLYVVNYLDFELADHKTCGGSLRLDCGPDAYPGEPDVLYRNNGDGTFTDVSAEAGIANPDGKGLGVATGDFDNDGDTDIYIANDDERNFLYENRGDGTFKDIAFFAGVGFNEHGEAEGGMGTAFGDMNNDNRLDLIVTNYQNQVNTLYRNDGAGLFADISHTSRTGPPSYSYVGWGVGFHDFDSDGWLDLFVSNGHLLLNAAAYDPTTTYAQRNFVYANQGGARFVEIGDGIEPIRSSRGAAFGDIDNDGDTDILVSNADATPTLLENVTESGHNWLGVQLRGAAPNGFAVGAQLRLTAGGQTQRREITGGSSYASASDLRARFGLGESNIVERLEIRWASGRIQTEVELPANRYVVFAEKD